MLLFYDGTIEARHALLRCAKLATAVAASVHVVAVADLLSANASAAGMLMPDAALQIERDACTTLNEAIEQLSLHGIIAHGYVAYGETTEAVLNSVALFHSDIVMIGYRPRTGFKRWFGTLPVHYGVAERLKDSMLVTVTVG
jgi:nucleotide-binding universal stress UspA family protein